MPLPYKNLVAPLVFLLFLGTAAALVVPVAARLKGGITAAPTLEPMAKPTPPEIESASPDGTLASFVVNDTGDAADSNIGNGICDTNAAPGDQCTLRAAIQETNAVFSNDTITFSLPARSTITPRTALPDINDNLTLTGPGSTQLTVTRSTAGGTPAFRIFTVNGATTNFSGLTITNGKTQDGVSSETVAPGGGISQNGGAMTLTDVAVVGNRTGNGGNVTSGFSTSFGGSGGGINSVNGTLTMTSCVISNNSTGNGGSNTSSGSSSGGWGGVSGRIHNSGTLPLTRTLTSHHITGNGGPGGSGGSGGRGAGIFIVSGTLTLNNVTITENHTGDSGGARGGKKGHGGGSFSHRKEHVLNTKRLAHFKNTHRHHNHT